MKRSAFWARLLALVLVLGLIVGCFAGCSSKVTDKDDDDDDKGSISETKDDDSDDETEESKETEESEKTEPTASTAVPRPLPTDPSDEVTEPSSEATEPSTEATEPTAGLDTSIAGKYWLYGMIDDGVEIDYTSLIKIDYDTSYLLLNTDGTAEMYMTDAETQYLTWSSSPMYLTDGIDILEFTLEGDLLTLTADTTVAIYAIEGSPLLDIPADPTDPVDPTDPITEPTTKPTEPPVEYVTLTVHSVDPDWFDLYFWGWNSITMENLSAEWPGEAMHKSGNVYTLQIPTWIDSGVLYANSCGVQTEDMALDTSGDIWIVVNISTITILDREPTAEELKPETTEPETFTVHAYVDNDVCIWGVPNMWAWNRDTLENLYAEWPGEAMTGEGGGWYTIEVPTTMNAIVISGVDVQTIDFWLDGEPEVWVVCNSGTDAAAYTYKPSGNELLPPAAPTSFTLRAKVPADWENPGCWAWQLGGENVFEAWPGEAMTLSDGWYTIELPTWADSFIVNANEGADQIDDVTLYEISDIWILIGEEKITYYDYEPSAEDLAEHGF